MTSIQYIPGSTIPEQSMCECSIENCKIKIRNYRKIYVGEGFSFLCPFHTWGNMNAYNKCEKCDCFFHKDRVSNMCKPCERIKPIGSKNKICSSLGCGSYYTRYVMDPYAWEIHDKKVYSWMCKNCCAQSSNDI